MDVRLWWQWPTWPQQQPQLHQKSSWTSCWSWSRCQYGCLWIQSYYLRFQRWLDHLVIRWWGSRKIRTWPLYIKRLVCCSNCRIFSFLATTSTNLTKLIISLSVIKTFNNLFFWGKCLIKSNFHIYCYEKTDKKLKLRRFFSNLDMIDLNLKKSQIK